MNVIACLNDVIEIEMFEHLGIQGLLLPVAGFSSKATRSFSVHEISSITTIMQERGLYCYLQMNTIIHETDILGLRSCIEGLKQIPFHALICYDYTVAIIAKEYGLGTKIIYQPGTQNTNAFDPTFYERQGIKGITISPEITLEDIIFITEQTDHIELSIIGHGYLPMFYSGRQLITSYFDYVKSPKSYLNDESLTIEEEVRKGLVYPIYEDSFGTHIFRPKALQSFQELMVLRPFITDFFVERLFLSIEEYCYAIECILGKKDSNAFLALYPHYDSGFYYKKTSSKKEEVK